MDGDAGRNGIDPPRAFVLAFTDGGVEWLFRLRVRRSGGKLEWLLRDAWLFSLRL